MNRESKSNFNFLLSASGFSNLADGIAGFAYPWLFSLITRDPQLISLIVVFSTLPHLMFVLFAGVIADKYNRQSILVFTRVIQILLTGIYIVIIYINLEFIPKSVQLTEPEFKSKFFIITISYILALIFGVLEVTRDNAAQSFLPQIVEKENLQKANGRLFGIELITNNFLGAPIAGFLIGISLITPFIADTILLVFSSFFIFKIKGNFKRENNSNSGQKTIPMIKDGITWLNSQSLLKRLAIYTGLANFLGAMQYPIMILFAQEILNLNSVQYGFLAYGAALGGVLGSYFAEKINNKLKESKTLLIGMMLFSIGMYLPYITKNAILVASAFALTSFGSIIWNVQAVSIRQSIIPDNLLGRVNSVYRLLALGLTPIGALVGGTLVKLTELNLSREFALRLPFLIAGICMLFIFLTAFKLLSQNLIDNTKNNTLNQNSKD